jgi:hypothetical protein
MSEEMFMPSQITTASGLAALVEGSAIRSACYMTVVARDTVLRLSEGRT